MNRSAAVLLISVCLALTAQRAGFTDEYAPSDIITCSPVYPVDTDLYLTIAWAGKDRFTMSMLEDLGWSGTRDRGTDPAQFSVEENREKPAPDISADGGGIEGVRLGQPEFLSNAKKLLAFTASEKDPIGRERVLALRIDAGGSHHGQLRLNNRVIEDVGCRVSPDFLRGIQN